MKYMLDYQVRTAGLTYDQNLDSQDALLRAFAKWTPEEGLTVLAFVSNLKGGGYVLVEAGDPGVVYSFVAKFAYWNDVNVVPVVDVAELIPIGTESLAWTRNALSD